MSTAILVSEPVQSAAELRYFLDQAEANHMDMNLCNIEVVIEGKRSTLLIATIQQEVLTDGSIVHNILLCGAKAGQS